MIKRKPKKNPLVEPYKMQEWLVKEIDKKDEAITKLKNKISEIENDIQIITKEKIKLLKELAASIKKYGEL